MSVCSVTQTSLRLRARILKFNRCYKPKIKKMAETINRKRERGANYTLEEKALLADLVMQYKHIIEDKRSGGIYLNKKKDTWQAITAKYNSSSTSGCRTTEQLKALYDNMKQKARKNVGESNKAEYLARHNLTEDDLAMALKNIKEDKVQIKKTGGGFYKPQSTDGDAKILAIIQDQVQPLANPFDSSAEYFKDHMTENSQPSQKPEELHQELPVIIEPGPLECLVQSAQPIQVELLSHSGSGVEVCGIKKSMKMKYDKKVVPKKVEKKKLSAEALKRIYFKKKCQNAYLERKKIMLEILQMKQQHSLKMAILKKQLQ